MSTPHLLLHHLRGDPPKQPDAYARHGLQHRPSAIVHSLAVESVDSVAAHQSGHSRTDQPPNFPFTSFAPDSTWAINTQSAIDVEMAWHYMWLPVGSETPLTACLLPLRHHTSRMPRLRRLLAMCGTRYEHQFTLCQTMASTATLTSWKIGSSQRLRCGTSNATPIGCGRTSIH